MVDIKKIFTFLDYGLQERKSDNSLISATTAIRRAEIAEEQGIIGSTIGSQYVWLINELGDQYATDTYKRKQFDNREPNIQWSTLR